jgi:uncharacterized protein (DUF1697 family)
MRWLALLRGVSPQNASSAALKRAFESAGWTAVRTVLSSGNVLFTATGPSASLQRRAEESLRDTLGRAIAVHLRPVDQLRVLLESDPFASFAIEPEAKRVVTFLRAPPAPGFELPPARDGVHMLAVREREVLTVYLPHPSGPRFMAQLERAFGADQTTRTWETVRKCVAAA